MNQDQGPRPTVVVIGGGYGGVAVARALDADVDVVLVEPKDSFVHNIGALRALVDPTFLPKIFLPYSALLAQGRVVRDRAVEVDAHRVVLASGEAITADYVVLATGSTYPFPAKSNAHDAEDAMDNYRAAYSELTHADRVLLVGAGPVGIELAGEILSKWPDKHVTLLDLADDVLGGNFRPDLRAELRQQLVDLGVELVLGVGLRQLPPTVSAEHATFTVTTNSGREITADIWFQCFGVTPVSDYLSGDLAVARQPDGFVTVGPALQVAGHDNVFAIGDCAACEWPEKKALGKLVRRKSFTFSGLRRSSKNMALVFADLDDGGDNAFVVVPADGELHISLCGGFELGVVDELACQCGV